MSGEKARRTSPASDIKMSDVTKELLRQRKLDASKLTEAALAKLEEQSAGDVAYAVKAANRNALREGLDVVRAADIERAISERSRRRRRTLWCFLLMTGGALLATGMQMIFSVASGTLQRVGGAILVVLGSIVVAMNVTLDAIGTSADSAPKSDSTATSKGRAQALASTYLAHFQRRNRLPKLALGSLSLLLGLAGWLNLAPTLPAAGLSAGLFILIVLKEAVLRYRISHGFFGNTDAEIRTLIRFLFENAHRIDFDDSNGKPRPAFERVPTVEPGTFPAGAATE